LALNGDLHLLKWAQNKGYSLNEDTSSCAAFGGHLEVLKWLKENGCPWDYYTSLCAVRGGQLAALKYLHENGYLANQDEAAFNDAAEYLEIFLWALENSWINSSKEDLKLLLQHLQRKTELQNIRRELERMIQLEDEIKLELRRDEQEEEKKRQIERNGLLLEQLRALQLKAAQIDERMKELEDKRKQTARKWLLFRLLQLEEGLLTIEQLEQKRTQLAARTRSLVEEIIISAEEVAVEADRLQIAKLEQQLEDQIRINQEHWQ